MAPVYIVMPNYTTRPPPSLQSAASTYNQNTAPQQRSCPETAGTGNLAEPKVAPSASPGTLFLGDILRDPLGPELKVINRRDRLLIPREFLVLPPDIKKGFKESRISLMRGRVGIWASFLASIGFPVGVDIGALLERNSNDIISAEAMETQEMEVDDEFVRRTMKLASVEAYIEGCRGRLPLLYMVTGLKIVHGASAIANTMTKMGASVGADAPGADAIKLVEFTKSRGMGQKFDWSTPFVLAFRARKISYKKGKWQHSLSLQGATMMGDEDVKTTKIEIDGLGEDVVPDADMIRFEEVLATTDKEEDLEWIISYTE